jgi:hypothetical protein
MLCVMLFEKERGEPLLLGLASTEQYIFLSEISLLSTRSYHIEYLLGQPEIERFSLATLRVNGHFAG